MIYPLNFEQKIGFDLIRDILEKNCLCNLGIQKVKKIIFKSNYHALKDTLEETSEAKTLFQTEEEFPQSNYIDLSDCFNKIKVEGAFITQEELHFLYKSLLTIQSIILFFKNKEDDYPHLTTKSGNAENHKDIIQSITKILDAHGNIKDNASAELQTVRTKIANKRASISKIMQSQLQIAIKEGWSEEGTTLSIREGRMVIAVSSSYKRKINGYLHDESATGKTAFIEPSEAFEANNEIQRLLSDEKREITKILLAFTNEIRPSLPSLHNSYAFLAEIDFLRAKALLAIDMDAGMPTLTNGQILHFEEAKHPLLIRSFRKQKKEVVPLRIVLNENQRIIVISGPNAGGKSVCIKTVGLLQYMLQCGLLIPVGTHSEAGIFENIFIDIGDEQSLENDLSTYSSHLTNMKNFVVHGTKKTLVLIDEFGTGTEPLLGGAIAESILEELNNLNVFGVINTHYTNLKHFASKHEGCLNGAMLFDSENLRPLYKLRIGSAGSSFAFEIAQNIGISQSILKRAEELIGKEHVDYDKNLKKLEKEKQFVFKKKQEIKIQHENLHNQLEKYKNELIKLHEQKQKIIEDAKNQAEKIMSETNKKIEQTIKEIKESNADKSITIKAREKLKEHKEQIENRQTNDDLIDKQIEKIKQRLARKKQKKAEKTENKPHKKDLIKLTEAIDPTLRIGDKVKIKGQDAKGEIIEIKGNSLILGFGLFQTKTSIDKIEKVGNASKQAPKITISTNINNYDIHQKRLNFRSEIDVRGMRGDEALTQIQEFVEQAIMLNVGQLMILHGKGNGILRKLIREYLHSNKDVKNFSDAHVEMGGSGITIIEL